MKPIKFTRLRTVDGSPDAEILRAVVELPAPGEATGAHVAVHMARVVLTVAEAPRAAAMFIEQIRTNFSTGCVEVVCVVPEGREPEDVVAEVRAALGAPAPGAAELADVVAPIHGLDVPPGDLAQDLASPKQIG